MPDNELFLKSGVATAITSNSTNETIQVDVIPESLCAPASGNSPLIISYGTADPTASTPGMIYVKYSS